MLWGEIFAAGKSSEGKDQEMRQNACAGQVTAVLSDSLPLSGL